MAYIGWIITSVCLLFGGLILLVLLKKPDDDVKEWENDIN